jgi:hypothetical protein
MIIGPWGLDIGARRVGVWGLLNDWLIGGYLGLRCGVLGEGG